MKPYSDQTVYVSEHTSNREHNRDAQSQSQDLYSDLLTCFQSWKGNDSVGLN